MIRKKIEKAVVIGFAALAVFVFVRGFWLKNRKEPDKDKGQGITATAAVTEGIAKNNTPTAAEITEGITPTKAPSPTGEISQIPEPTETATPFPTPTEAPVNILNKPTPAPVMTTPTPVPEGTDAPGYDVRLQDFFDSFLDNGYESLYEDPDEYLFCKTETTTDTANLRMRKRTEYLYYETMYSEPSVVYVDEYYTTDETDIQEKHVHYKLRANDSADTDITAFHMHKEKNGEYVYDMLLPDGTTTKPLEEDIIRKVEAGQIAPESMVSGTVAFKNRRIKDQLVNNRFAFTVTLDYEDHVFGAVPEEPQYREFVFKVWFVDVYAYNAEADERGKSKPECLLLCEIKETIDYDNK